MIEKWSNRDNQNLLEYVKKGEKEFIDTRGKISNHELPEPINLIKSERKRKLKSIVRTLYNFNFITFCTQFNQYTYTKYFRPPLKSFADFAKFH